MEGLSLEAAAPELVTLPQELLQYIAACLRTLVCVKASALPRVAATCKVLRAALVAELAQARHRTLNLRSFLYKVNFYVKDMGGIFWRRPMVDTIFNGTKLTENGYEFPAQNVPYKIVSIERFGQDTDLSASELHYGLLGWPTLSGTPAMFVRAMQEDEDVIVGVLTQIDLVNNPRLGVEGMRALTALDRIGLLDTLTLQNCGVTDDAVRALIDAFRNANRARLQQLRLGGNPYGDDGLTTIVSASAKFPSLRVLQIGDTEVGDAGVEALAGAIDQGWLAHGTQIWLGGARVTQAGKQRLQAATSHLPDLRLCW